MEDHAGGAAACPAARARGRDRRRHRRQQPRPPPGAARLDRPRAARQGPAAEPGRLDRPRLELHLPGRPLARDDRADARQRAPVRGARRAHRLRRASRSRAPRSGWRSCGGAWRRPASWGVEGVRARHAGRGQGARPVHRRERDRRRLLHAESVGVVDSLRAGTLMRERAQETGALTVSANTEVLGIDVEGGRVARVRTDARRHRGRVRRRSPAASGARASRAWRARRSRSRRPCTR